MALGLSLAQGNGNRAQPGIRKIFMGLPVERYATSMTKITLAVLQRSKCTLESGGVAILAGWILVPLQ